MSELYIGLMSGTSVDAIDAVLMDFSKSNTSIIQTLSHPIDAQLKNDIDASIAKQAWPQNILGIDNAFTQISVATVAKLLANANVKAKNVRAIGSHGQTIFHDPNGSPAQSIQIGNAQLIANKTAIPTVSNFRQADIDVGGQGAPLASAYHARVLQSKDEERNILNLGGIANITNLPVSKSKPVIGFDTGPANTLLDAWVKKHLYKNFDENGVWAESGLTNEILLKLMLEDEYFKYSPPKSTGREKFNLIWLQYMLDQYEEFVTEKNVQSTLVSLTTKSIADAMNNWTPNCDRVILCGGGSSNTYLVQQLQILLGSIQVDHSSKFGIPEKWMEAMAFAWLAKQKVEGKPGNLPSVTGADKAVELGEYFEPN